MAKLYPRYPKKPCADTSDSVLPLEREKLSFARQTSKKHSALSKGVCFPCSNSPSSWCFLKPSAKRSSSREDEDTKTALIEAGTEPWSIYTLDELQILVAQNRIAPLSQDDLKKVHTLKRTFDAKIVEDLSACPDKNSRAWRGIGILSSDRTRRRPAAI